MSDLFCVAGDWRYRYAGLMTLSSTAEGAHKQMEAYLDQMIDPIVGFLKDSVLHPLFSTFLFSLIRLRFRGCKEKCW